MAKLASGYNLAVDESVDPGRAKRIEALATLVENRLPTDSKRLRAAMPADVSLDVWLAAETVFKAAKRREQFKTAVEAENRFGVATDVDRCDEDVNDEEDAA